MGKMLIRLRRRWIAIIALSIDSVDEFQFLDHFGESLLPKA